MIWDAVLGNFAVLAVWELPSDKDGNLDWDGAELDYFRRELIAKGLALPDTHFAKQNLEVYKRNQMMKIIAGLEGTHEDGTLGDVDDETLETLRKLQEKGTGAMELRQARLQQRYSYVNVECGDPKLPSPRVFTGGDLEELSKMKPSDIDMETLTPKCELRHNRFYLMVLCQELTDDLEPLELAKVLDKMQGQELEDGDFPHRIPSELVVTRLEHHQNKMGTLRGTAFAAETQEDVEEFKRYWSKETVEGPRAGDYSALMQTQLRDAELKQLREAELKKKHDEIGGDSCYVLGKLCQELEKSSKRTLIDRELAKQGTVKPLKKFCRDNRGTKQVRVGEELDIKNLF